jgi:hypothetical protein
VRIGRILLNAAYAEFEQLEVVPGWNDDRKHVKVPD